MLLSVAESARLLNVPEKTVHLLIKRKGLPASKTGEDYQINRVDLLEWATENSFKLSPEIFASAEPEHLHLPALSQALEAGGIHHNVRGDDQQSVLRNVISLLKLPSRIDPDFILQVLLAREALGTTAIGDGIAIPHARNPILLHLATPAIALCFLEKPIDFNALDNQPVHTLFTLTSPTARTYLHLLAKLAYALRDDRFRAVIRQQGNASEIIAAARTIEADLKP